MLRLRSPGGRRADCGERRAGRWIVSDVPEVVRFYLARSPGTTSRSCRSQACTMQDRDGTVGDGAGRASTSKPSSSSPCCGCAMHRSPSMRMGDLSICSCSGFRASAILAPSLYDPAQDRVERSRRPGVIQRARPRVDPARVVLAPIGLHQIFSYAASGTSGVLCGEEAVSWHRRCVVVPNRHAQPREQHLGIPAFAQAKRAIEVGELRVRLLSGSAPMKCCHSACSSSGRS